MMRNWGWTESLSDRPEWHCLDLVFHLVDVHARWLASTLSSTFYRRYERITQTLLASLSCYQAQVRSRSLEIDSSLLDVKRMGTEQYILPCDSED